MFEGNINVFIGTNVIGMLRTLVVACLDRSGTSALCRYV